MAGELEFVTYPFVPFYLKPVGMIVIVYSDSVHILDTEYSTQRNDYKRGFQIH